MKRFRRRLHRSDYYRPFLESNTSLANFPEMNKKLFMEHFDRINTAGIEKTEAMKLALKAEETRDFSPMLNGISIGMSSGTSGNKSLFLVSENERARWVAAVLDRILGFSFRRRKVAFFLRANNNLYTSARSGLIEFRFFDLILPVQSNLSQLEKFSPDILVAQPSMLREIARAKQKGEIHITPSKIISVAEILEPNDKSFFQSVFNLRIDEAYQCAEGFLASSCAHGTLHFHEDYLVIDRKYIDEEQKRFHPVITDLIRDTQPIINYELDDVIIEKVNCPCGNASMAIDQIEGRSDDILRFRGKSGEEVLVFPDFIRRAVILASDHVSFYTATQVGPQTLEWYIEMSDDQEEEGARKKVENSLKSLFEKLGIEGIRLEYINENKQDRGTKLRRIKNEYSISGKSSGSR